jgi:hypothetical protein
MQSTRLPWVIFVCFSSGCGEDGDPARSTENSPIDARDSPELLEEGAVISFENVNSGRCIGVDGASTADGAHVKQFDCDRAANQRWQVQSAGGSSVVFNLVNVNSAKCMGVDQGSDSPGADIRQFSCDSSANQRWAFAGEGQLWALFNDGSELCVGVDGASEDNGAQLKQFECDNRDNQIWEIGL